MTIPLAGPDIGPREIEAVTRVLQSGRLALGPELEAFEAALCATTTMPHAVAVSSGTSALHLGLQALEIGPGDEVLTTPFSFIASANAARHVGATPTFVEIEEESLNLDADRLEAAITPRTKAILVVHVFGRIAAMERIRAVAERHGLAVIEDACEAIGATYEGQSAGSFGDVSEYTSGLIAHGTLAFIIASFLLLAARARVPLFDTFVEGAKEGFKVAVAIVPYLVGMLVALGMLRNSGAIDYVLDGARATAEAMGIDTLLLSRWPRMARVSWLTAWHHLATIRSDHEAPGEASDPPPSNLDSRSDDRRCPYVLAA